MAYEVSTTEIARIKPAAKKYAVETGVPAGELKAS
jgi:hypothetical protein